MPVVIKKNFKRNHASGLTRSHFLGLSLFLTACGGEKTRSTEETKIIGFSSNFVPPKSNFDPPNTIDTNFKILEPRFVSSYWTKSLEMQDGTLEINNLLFNSDRIIKYSYPLEAPSYLPLTILGWAPANAKMISASEKIFEKLEEVLNIQMERSDSVEGFGNLAISQSIQAGVAGFSYFPNNFHELGSDVFIAKNYSNPSVLENGLTNFDYEVLVHEIGHALGLKHPFEGHGDNTNVLSAVEDNTRFTAMSYNSSSDTFDGTFRPLDWMTLTKLYGVNLNYNGGDDEYTFNDSTGVFIIDGNGIDVINASYSTKNIYIDLRYDTHSYQGSKSSFITSSNQLTISYGSDIENVHTGSGDDIIVANSLPNVITAGPGQDKIFAGDGPDIIFPGSGSDIIDLSEEKGFSDTIVFNTINEYSKSDLLYGFSQGAVGDRITFEGLDLSDLRLLPLIDTLNVPFGYIDNCVVRVFGENIDDFNGLSSYFDVGGIFENLKISEKKSAILVTAETQNTGETQNIYYLKKALDTVDVYPIVQLNGNHLDIDSWAIDNFII